MMQKVIERILNLLAFLLTVGRPVTAAEIRHTVKGYDQPSDEAFRRTFERDKDLLRSLGVPLEMRHTDMWEVELGYVVPSDDYGITDPGLTDEERSALLLAAQVVKFGGQATEIGAIFKLGGATPPSESGTIYADLGHDLDTLGSMYGAVTDRRFARFTYKQRDRVVEPYGLIHRNGHWYLVAPESGAPEPVKAFRVDRMTSLQIGDTPNMFARPAEFDVADTLQSLSADGGEDQHALVRFDTDVAAIAMSHVRDAVEVESDTDGVLVDIPITSERDLIGWMLGFDDRAVIEGPPGLRAAFVAFVKGPQ
ncbi:MAG: YafY family protein [Acidimicrobiia bacterium]|nr:MAG: YafY family protein [Acidimicrobiia bacterium]